jgi:hypothetical protein
MDAFLEFIIQNVEKEWAVVSGAPFLSGFLVLLAFVFAYLVVGKFHESRHATHEGTVEQKDAHIEFLEGQIEDYKAKLSGASPDQAAAKIETLTNDVATTRQQLEDVVKWWRHETFERHLSPEQKTALCEALRAIPTEARAFVYIAGATEREPHQYALELLATFRAEGFCATQFMPRPINFSSPDERGVLVVVSDEANPPPHAVAVLDALGKAQIDAKFDTFVVEQAGQKFPPMFCAVAVSHKPPAD